MATIEHPKVSRAKTAYQYLDAAAADYVAGDLTGSSANMWQATEVALSAVAKSRDWPHQTKDDLESVLWTLNKEFRELHLSGSWAVADTLRDNIQEDFLELGEIRMARLLILNFVGELLELARRSPAIP